jgi:hypothetical protein
MPAFWSPSSRDRTRSPSCSALGWRNLGERTHATALWHAGRRTQVLQGIIFLCVWRQRCMDVSGRRNEATAESRRARLVGVLIAVLGGAIRVSRVSSEPGQTLTEERRVSARGTY